MSSLDWLQIVAGFRYCLRRMIIAVASMLACPRKEPLVAVEAENAE
jgi:hypothetical protein